MSLGPNDLLPCGTDARRRDHAAHGRICLVCEPDAEWSAVCPICRGRVRVVGGVIAEHPLDDLIACPGGGTRVQVPQPAEPAPARTFGVQARRCRTVALAVVC